jgi:BASS family bile acid:Na+ symporter
MSGSWTSEVADVALYNPITQILLPLFAVAVMFALGTTLTLDELRYVFRHPRGFVAGAVIHALLMPLLAFALAFALRLPLELAVGLVLIAACPAAAPANFFTYLARGDTMLSVCLTAAASLTSVVTIPLFVNSALRLFASGHPAPGLPALTSSLALLAVSTLPVAAGMALRRRHPAAARAVERRMGTVGLAVVAFVAVVAFWSLREILLPALARAGGPALLLNVLTVLVAWGMAAVVGLGQRQRIAVVLECTLQNFALAAFVALTLLSDPAILMPPLAYALICFLPASVIVGLGRRAVAAEAQGEPARVSG